MSESEGENIEGKRGNKMPINADRLFCKICGKTTQHYTADTNNDVRVLRKIFCEECRFLKIQLRGNVYQEWK